MHVALNCQYEARQKDHLHRRKPSDHPAAEIAPGQEDPHSGKQSWAWYIREPAPERLEAQIMSAGEGLRPVLSELILFGLDAFDKHPEAAKAIREALRVRGE